MNDFPAVISISAGLSPPRRYLDDLGINCKPAAAMGMTAIKVTSGEQALIDLEKLLEFSLG